MPCVLPRQRSLSFDHADTLRRGLREISTGAQCLRHTDEPRALTHIHLQRWRCMLEDTEDAGEGYSCCRLMALEICTGFDLGGSGNGFQSWYLHLCFSQGFQCLREPFVKSKQCRICFSHAPAVPGWWKYHEQTKSLCLSAPEMTP